MITLAPRPWTTSDGVNLKRRLRKGRQWEEVTLPPRIRSPFVVNCGVGTDSIAALILLAGMVQLGDEDAMPDLILFADTGDEKATTYAYIPILQEYLVKVGLPALTIVRRGGKHPSLSASCLELSTMPSLAYGGKSCSLKWKAAAMDKYLNHWLPARLAWAVGLPVRKLIGYDGGKSDCRRSDIQGDGKFEFIYPLRDARLQREDLIAIIDRAGLPQPGKSACYMCPASKRHEVVSLALAEPAKCAEALRMEAKAMHRTAREKPEFSTKGLGRTWAWREHLAAEQPDLLVDLMITYDTGANDWREYKRIVDKRAV